MSEYQVKPQRARPLLILMLTQLLPEPGGAFVVPAEGIGFLVCITGFL
jgi:hypothetical protein